MFPRTIWNKDNFTVVAEVVAILQNDRKTVETAGTALSVVGFCAWRHPCGRPAKYCRDAHAQFAG